MEKSRTNPEVDRFFHCAKKRAKEMERLREIILRTPLTEELKWGKPCYTCQGKNVVLILGFKDYSALLFCKGALLKDPRGLLIRPGEHTQAARQLRFASLQVINELESATRALLDEAVAVEKAGREVIYKKPTDIALPDELKRRFDRSTALKTAFKALTPGRQRAYILHFSAAKHSATRDSRIEECEKLILAGKGLQDDYRATKG